MFDYTQIELYIFARMFPDDPPRQRIDKHPPRMEDLERWEGLLRCELERVLSIFLTPSEAEQAVGGIGTPEFDGVLAYLGRIQERAGKDAFGPYGGER